MKVLSALVAFLIGSSALAQTGRQAFHELVGTPVNVTAGQFLRPRAAVRPASVITESGSASFVFPVAINSPGKNGTFFKSDVTLANNRGIAQDVLVFWLPAGTSGASALGTRYTLQALSVYFLRDFLGNDAGDLNKAGVGAILVIGVLSGSSTPDSSANLDGSIRIWTFMPGSSGTNSFNMAPTWGSVSGIAIATAYGLRQDSGFRTNVGIANLDPNSAHTWTVRVVGNGQETSFNVNVPALSMQEVAVPASVDYGDIFIEFYADFGSFDWSAFGVSADEITGDAWSTRAEQ